MDEPTNYLDFQGQEQLESEILAHGATAVFMSHDRAFVERTFEAKLFSTRGTGSISFSSRREDLLMTQSPHALITPRFANLLDENMYREALKREHYVVIPRRTELAASVLASLQTFFCESARFPFYERWRDRAIWRYCRRGHGVEFAAADACWTTRAPLTLADRRNYAPHMAALATLTRQLLSMLPYEDRAPSGTVSFNVCRTYDCIIDAVRGSDPTFIAALCINKSKASRVRMQLTRRANAEARVIYSYLEPGEIFIWKDVEYLYAMEHSITAAMDCSTDVMTITIS